MQILIAEDDAVSRKVLQALLNKWHWPATVVVDGAAAWEVLQQPDAPRVAVLDWIMPGLDGLELCRRVRAGPQGKSSYLLLLTGRDRPEDIVHGLEAGADDYVTKPFDHNELHARILTGLRIVRLQEELACRIQELEEMMSRISQLQGLLPICCYCKRIRDDQNYWQQVENYIAKHSGAQFSHGVCPECYEKILEPELQALHRERQASRGRG
ncbi:response regulator transcription factor [bacterium]|nr:response regulator transcription factor [bacterium]